MTKVESEFDIAYLQRKCIQAPHGGKFQHLITEI